MQFYSKRLKNAYSNKKKSHNKLKNNNSFSKESNIDKISIKKGDNNSNFIKNESKFNSDNSKNKSNDNCEIINLDINFEEINLKNENLELNTLERIKLLNPSYKQTKISDIISHFKTKISETNKRNSELIEEKINMQNPKIESLINLNKNCYYSITEKDNILKDLSFENKIFHHWRSYLKKKQENQFFSGGKYMTFQDELKSTNSDDIVCVVCNDGDYEENDLIVYCAVRKYFFIFYFLYVTFNNRNANLQYIKIVME